jgi:hypothetical protein
VTRRRSGRGLIVAGALLLAVVVAVSAGYFYLSGKLHADTMRAWYFLYLGGLIAAALLLSGFRWLAALLLLLATVEAGLGLSAGVLYKFGLAPANALLPEDERLEQPVDWHPLLQVVLKPSQPGDWEEGGVHHNKQGLRGPDRTAPSLAGKTVIELFGGSNAYDVFSREDQAWANLLEKLLGAERYAVLNHAVPGYASAEHVVQTAFYQTPYGETPRCAAYTMGWGDLHNIHVQGLDPGYADYHLPWLVDALHVRRLARQWMMISPVFFNLGRWAAERVDTVRTVDPPARSGPGRGGDPALEAIYARNVRSISAINRQRGIATVWIAQPMNAKANPAMWADVQRLNAIVQREAAALGDTWIEVPMDKFEPADFKNLIHFLPPGSKKFAELLAPPLGAACR